MARFSTEQLLGGGIGAPSDIGVAPEPATPEPAAPAPTPTETPAEPVGHRFSNAQLGFPPPTPNLSDPVQAATVQDSPLGRTMDTLSQGWGSTGQGWGGKTLGMDAEDYKWMDDHGFTKDGKLANVFRAINETFLQAGAAEYQQRELEHELEKGTAREAGVRAAIESATGGARELAGAVTEPGVLPTETPSILKGIMGIAGAPIAGIGKFIEEAEPTELIKKALAEDVNRPWWSPGLQTPADIIQTARMGIRFHPEGIRPGEPINLTKLGEAVEEQHAAQLEKAKALQAQEQAERAGVPTPDDVKATLEPKPPDPEKPDERPPLTKKDMRDLEIVGPDKPEPEMTDSPSESAEKAVPHSLSAEVTQEGQNKILGHKPGDYDATGKEWVDKIDEPEDVRQAVEEIAKANDYFPEARGGQVSVATKNAVAEAAGVAPTEIDDGYFTTHFDNDGKVRAVIQVLRQTAQDYAVAAKTARLEPTVENLAAAEEARLRATHAIEYTMGKRAESGRTLNTWKELLVETEVTKAKTELTGHEQTGAAPVGTSDVVDAAHETRKALKDAAQAEPGKEKPIGLQRLVDNAQDLVDNAAKPPPEPKPGVPRAPRSPEVNSLVDAARDVLKKFGVHDPEFAAFRDELEKLSRGEGKLDTTVEAARDLLKKTEKPKPEGEIGVAAEPKVKSVKSQLKAAAQRLVDAAEGAEAKVKGAPSEIADLLETTRQAVGRLRGQQVSSEMSAFTEALRGKDPQAAAEAARALIEAEGKEKSPVAARAPTEYATVMGAARKVAKSAEERAAAAAKPELMPDIKEAVQGAADAAKELQAQRKSVLGQLVKQAEDQAINMTKQRPVKEAAEALPEEFQYLINKTKRVVDRFGGTTRAEKAALLLGRAGATAEEAERNVRSVAGLTPNQQAAVLARVTKQGLMQRPGWFYWGWQQGLISGVLTHTKYQVTNVSTIFLERTLSPVTAALIGKLKGEETSVMAPIYGNVAMIKAVPDAVRAARQAFATGQRVPLQSEIRLFERGEESPQLGAQQLPFGQTMGPDWGIWRKVASDETLNNVAHFIGSPGKAANFIHTFYKVLSERASAASIAFEKAALEEGKAWPSEERYQYHYANPTDEALKKSVTDAYTGAFMAKLGPKGEAVARFMQLPLLKWIFPFQHIPINIVTMSQEYAGPLAMLDKTTRAAVMGKLGATAAERSAAQNLAIAKMVVGSSVMTYFVHKGLAGEATGDYPHDPEERRRWEMLGIQPNSIQIGGQWVSMERLGAAGNVAMIGANLGQTYRNYHAARERGEGIDDAITAAIWGGSFGTAKILGTETGLQSLHNIMNAIEDPKEAMKFLRWQAGSMIPFSSMASQNASFFDPYMRQTNSILDALKYRLPWARKTLPAKLDPAFGEPVPNPGFHTVFRGTPVNKDPMRAEMDRAGYFPAAPQGVVKGVKLTPEQHDEYQVTSGMLARQMVDAVLQTPGWAERTFAERHEAIQKVMEAARKGGSALMMMHPEIRDEAYQQRYDYLTGKSSTPRPKTPPPLTAPGLTTSAAAAPQPPMKPGESFRPGLPTPATAPQMRTLPPPATPPGGAEETPASLGIRG